MGNEKHDWVIDVLSDIETYLSRNGLGGDAEQIAAARRTISVRRKGPGPSLAYSRFAERD